MKGFPVPAALAGGGYLLEGTGFDEALGAKVTGGGRGGYMNALTPGKELQDKIASAMEKEGYKVIRTTVGGC